jgi:hypothetical protein
MVRGLITSLALVYLSGPVQAQILAGILNVQSGPPAPVYQSTDSFIGAAATPLSSHTDDQGHSWIQVFSGTWSPTLTLTGANSLTTASFTTPSVYYVNFSPSSANYTVSVPCTIGSGWCIAWARINAPSSSNLAGYACLFGNSTGISGIYLYSVAGAASFTQIGTTNTTAITGNHTVGIKTNGSTITCQLDGADLTGATGSDSTYSTAGFAGIGLYNASGASTINGTFTVQ